VCIMPLEVHGSEPDRNPSKGKLHKKYSFTNYAVPTGALDSRAAAGVMDLFESINREGQTILMVTHSIQAASHASRVLFIKDGEVYHQIYRGMSGQREMLQKISDTLTLITAGREEA